MKNLYTRQVIAQLTARLLFVTAVGVAILFVSVPDIFAETFNVTTQYPTKTTPKETLFSGYVVSSTSTFTSTWFEYGKNGKLDQKTQKRNVLGNNDFWGAAYGLEEGVTYTFRAVARQESTAQTRYGNLEQFTVTSPASNKKYSSSTTKTQTVTVDSTGHLSGLTPTNSSVSSVGSNSLEVTSTGVTLKGTVSTGGIPAVGWFEWGQTEGLGNETPDQEISAQNCSVTMTAVVDGLTPNTTYFYRPVVLTEAGRENGVIATFTTKKSGSGGLFGNLFGGGTDTTTSGNVSLEGSNGGSGSLNGNDSGTMQFSGDPSVEKETIGALGWGNALRSQFFTIDQEGKINVSEEMFAEESGTSNFLTASAFSVGAFLPGSFLGWLLWVVILFIGISQLRRYSASRRKQREEREQRDQEMKVMKQYQEEALFQGKKKLPA